MTRSKNPGKNLSRRKQEILRTMSASELADIGVKPGDIDHIVQHLKY
ncbi:MAG: hypothetical protein R3D32_03760 [Nitratireductor sp.]